MRRRWQWRERFEEKTFDTSKLEDVHSLKIWQMKNSWKQRNPQFYAFKPNDHFEGYFKSIFPFKPVIIFALNVVLFTFSCPCMHLWYISWVVNVWNNIHGILYYHSYLILPERVIWFLLDNKRKFIFTAEAYMSTKVYIYVNCRIACYKIIEINNCSEEFSMQCYLC